MSNPIYINGIGAVSAQGTWRKEIFEEATPIAQAITPALKPNYKDLIAPAMIRRMSKGVKMSIYAAQQSLDEAEMSQLDAIITGTGMGCSEDSEKFLRNILDDNESYLTPTAFIQSTHNTVAAQIALRLGCKAYNFTYVNGSSSFESALLDAVLQLQCGEATNALVGGVDEIADHSYGLLQLIGYINNSETEVSLRNNKGTAVNYSEGATFFALSTNPTASSYAKLLDLTLINSRSEAEIPDFVIDFLRENQMELDQIDALVVGINGDQESDSYYHSLAALIPQADVLYYKQQSGQYDTASSYGLAVGAQLLKSQFAAPSLLWQDAKNTSYKNVLLYNQFKGKDHTLLLLQSC